MMNTYNNSPRGLTWSGIVCALLAIWGCSPATPPAGGTGTRETATPDSSGNAAAPAGGTRRLILLTNGDSPFWDACRAGMEDAKKELKLADAGFDAILDVNNGQVDGQISKLRQYASQNDIAGVAISAINAQNANVADELRKLKKKGVAVVTIDSDVDRAKYRDARTCFIGTDNFKGGEELGVCAKLLLPDGGEYATFVGLTGAQNAKERIDGFAKGAGEKFKSVNNLSDDFDRSKARENVRNAIRNNADLKALVGIYSYNAPAICDVVTQMENRVKFKIITFDAEPDAIKQMGNGTIDAMMVQNPYQMGYQGVQVLKSLVLDDQAKLKELLPNLGQPDGDIYDTGLKVVVPEGDTPLKKDAFSPKTQYVTLPEFREWLKKYNLTGS